MAEPVDAWNPKNLNDNIYISKRSFRKAFIRTRHYLPCIPSEREGNSGLRGGCEQQEANSSMPCCPDLLLCIKSEPMECYLSDKFSELSPREETKVDVTPCLPVWSGGNTEKSPRAVQEEEDDAASDGRVEEDKGKEGQKAQPTEGSKADDKACLIFPAMKRRGVEGDMENRPYKCTQCNWAFTKSSNLVSHIRTHSGLKPHVCELCGKAYSHQGTLQQHKRLHTGKRPYHCPFCEKTYIWSSDYRKHIRTHTGEKPYICGVCGKDFVRSSDLRKHERTMHANNKPFPCAKCGKTFNKPLSLLRHERTHMGKRPFVCPECGKAFAMPSRMMEHRKVHSGVRPYVCHVCNKAFTKSSNLLEHQSIHSGLRPHKCTECGVAFAMASRLVRHQRVHSGQ